MNLDYLRLKEFAMTNPLLTLFIFTHWIQQPILKLHILIFHEFHNHSDSYFSKKNSNEKPTRHVKKK